MTDFVTEVNLKIDQDGSNTGCIPRMDLSLGGKISIELNKASCKRDIRICLHTYVKRLETDMSFCGGIKINTSKRCRSSANEWKDCSNCESEDVEGQHYV